MKKKYKLLFLSLIFSLSAYTQVTDDCNINLNRAYSYLKYSKSRGTYEADSTKAVEYIKPCVKKKNPTAQLLMAELYLKSNNEKHIRKGVRLTKKAAKQKLPLASYKLGLIFKYGRGVDVNLKKATKWFKKGYKLGNQKSAYSLGYMYLKGFGNEKQDYKKAVKWFKKSDYAMSKHWLATCYYLGYGVKQNKKKAIRILKENEIKKSGILLNSLESMTKSNQLSKEEIFVLNKIKDLDFLENNLKNLNELIGLWDGDMIQFDWSKSSVMQRIPTKIVFKKDSLSDQILYEIIINDKKINTHELEVYSDEVKLSEIPLDIKHPYSSIEQDTQIYNLSPLKINLINNEDKQLMVFNSDSYINDWKEPGAPLSFILKKQRNLTNNNVEITNEAIENLNSQSNFVKTYPNPFKKDFLIAYDLKRNSDVNIQITNINSTKFYNVLNVRNQKKGSYVYNFNGNELLKGVYIVRISHSEGIETKMIIKD